MHRALIPFAALGTAAALLAACGDDPTSPNGDAASARVTGGDAPSNLTASARSTTQVDLTWTDNSRNETGFEIHRSATGATGDYVFVVRTAQNATAYSDQQLTPSTEYCYKVRWIRVTGKTTTSDFSDPACAYTQGPPPAPTNVKAVPNSYDGVVYISVNWTQLSPLAEGFRVERSEPPAGEWTQIAQTPWTSYSDRYRPLEVEVCYRVTALNATHGNSPPSGVACTAPPAPPAELAARAVGPQDIELTWKAVSRFAEGYEVHRGSEPWNTVLITTLPANATSYRDVGLAEGRYHYRMRAVNDGGFSGFTSTVNALSSLTPPTASPTIDAYAGGSETVGLSWTAQPTNVDGYIIERSLDDGVTWTEVERVNAFQSSYQDGGLMPDQRVCYQLTAYNGAGKAPPSNKDCVALPAVVTDLHAAPGGNGAVDLRWTDPSRVNTGYVLEYLGMRCGWYYCYEEWQHYTTIGDVTAFRVEGLDGSTFHQFRLITVGPDGNSEPSVPAGSYTEPVPNAPSGLIVTAVTTSRVDLRWTDNSTEETEFVVERCEGGADVCEGPNSLYYFYTHLSIPENATEASDTRVQVGATYTYRVVAYNQYARSTPSNTVLVYIPATLQE